MHFPKHWHGHFQRRSNWADGVSYVTQCPIRQQEILDQEFSITSQTGTYWYHSHYTTQYCDGLRGPLAYLYDVDDGGSPLIFVLALSLNLNRKYRHLTLGLVSNPYRAVMRIFADLDLGTTPPLSNLAKASK